MQPAQYASRRHHLVSRRPVGRYSVHEGRHFPEPPLGLHDRLAIGQQPNRRHLHHAGDPCPPEVLVNPLGPVSGGARREGLEHMPLPAGLHEGDRGTAEAALR